jgi:hypothetical protein
MTAIAIHRFHARYRLTPGAAGQRERLQRILAEVLDSGLEAAVGQSGIDTAGELCIREVNALVRLNLGASDAALAAELALAIAAAIAAGAGQRGEELVRYGSRAHALIDLAVAAAGGDFTRSWAWQRLGLWDAEPAVSTHVSPEDAVRLVLRALTAEPRHAVAALAHLARHPRLFERLLEHAPPSQWQGLSAAVIRTTGARVDVLLPLAEESAPSIQSQVETARRLAGRSVIARAVAASGTGGWAADARRHALAALAVCEIEPALLCAPVERARALVHAVATELVAHAGLRERCERPGTPFRPLDILPTVETPRGASPSEVPAVPQRSLGINGAAAGDAPRGVSTVGGAADRSTAKLAPMPPGPLSHTASPEPLPEVRRRASTRFGGLLYLIHLAGRLALAERIVQESRLAERSPRWCLHQLALALVAVPPSDPAALAFAGLLPESEPPCEDQPAPTESETAVIAELRGELLRGLRELLDRPNDTEAVLVDLICLRTAEIVADPGWMDVRFSLDDVRTEIRAAGLDLDPGWVPWLGLVIRFVYV